MIYLVKKRFHKKDLNLDGKLTEISSWKIYLFIMPKTQKKWKEYGREGQKRE